MSGGTFGDLFGGPRLRRSVIDPVTGQPVVTSAPTGEVRQRASLLPVGRDDNGALVPAVPQGIFDVIDAARFPGQVARGEKAVFDPATGHVSDEAMSAASGIAGLAMTGSLPFSAPKGALRSFGGRNAATADLAKLSEAEGMAARGADRQAIWDRTGWFRGADDQWRFEIPDDKAGFSRGAAADFKNPHGMAAGRAGDVFPHAEVYKAYPQLRDLHVGISNDPSIRPDLAGGSFSAGAIEGRASELGSARSLMLHEMQHAIQAAEGFQPGGSPRQFTRAMWADERLAPFTAERADIESTFPTARAAVATRDELRSLLEERYGPDWRTTATPRHLDGMDLAETNVALTPGGISLSKADKAYRKQADFVNDDDMAGFSLPLWQRERYWRLPGEVEARNVQDRRDLKPEQRRATPPWRTQDVPDELQAAASKGTRLYSGGPAGAVPAAIGAGATAEPASKPSSGAKMAGLFDDLLARPAPDALAPASSPAQAGQSGGPGLFDDLLARPAPKAAEVSTAADVAQSAGAGIIRGAAGLLDLPQTAYQILDGIAGGGARVALRAVGITPQSDLGADTRSQSLIPSPADLPKPGETAIRGLEAATGKLYEPQTRAGKFARAAAEFVPGAGRKLGDVIAYGVVPGLASEGAGQVTEGSALETPARIAAPVLAALGGAVVRAPANVERQIAGRTKGTTAEQVDQAETLFREASERGLPLTRANALDAVTKGVTSLGDLQRVVEGRGGLRGFFASTADGVRREGEGVLDTIAPRATEPAVLGGEVRDAARAAVAQTPEGQALGRAQEAVGPRVTPEEAGQVIQPALQRVYDRREGMRAALGEQDYAAARNAPEGVGIERQVTVERPGEPVVTRPQGRPQFTDAAPRPLEPYQRPVAEAAEAGPESLARFVARNGGLRLDGDVTATDLHRFNVPGLGTVARQGGKGIDDFWREHLIDHGYLRPDADGGAARDITSELLRKLQNEQRGVPSFPVGAERGGAAGRSVSRQADEYAEALSTAEARLDQDLRAAGVPPESVHPDIRSRTLGAIMRGEAADPLTAYGRVIDGMREPPAPYVKSTTVAEQIPDVRFGQTSPQAVVDHIDRLLETAKGPAAKALGDARKALFRPGGRDLELSVEGLHNARDAIGDMIAKAEPAAQRTLLGVRDRLDQALAAVPEYETARAGYEAASRNLDAFGEGTAPGRIAARDKATGRSTMAPEKVPEAIAEGPTPARQFNEVAPPEARQAMEGRLATQILDGIGETPGAASAGTIRTALRQHEDLFRQFPAVRDRLQAVAAAHDGIEAVMRSPIGKIASRPVVRDAIEALFPTGARGVSPEEVSRAVTGMARNNAKAAQDLVRMHVEHVFQDATQRLQSGANQAGGPRFSRALVGHPGEGASVEAAIRALPGGEETWKGVRRLLDIFDAQGARQAIGSGTTFNNAIEADLRAGRPVAEAGSAVITGGLKLPGRIMDRIEQWRLGNGLDELAQLFTDPKMASTFRRLATQPPNSAGLARVTSMILERAVRGYGATQRANPAADPEWKPLQFTVRAPR